MADQSRIYARPAEVEHTAPSGRLPLGTEQEHDSYLYVPASYRVTSPSPLLVFMHGSGGHALHGMELLQHLADETGLILAAPASPHYTWDTTLSRYHSRDGQLVNNSLAYVFSNYAVDPTRLAIGGFSDGASFALTLGLMNGDLFTHVIAFSPGEITPRNIRGIPQVFLAHGSRDEIQSVFSGSRRLAPLLERAGLKVEYVEFDAGHRIPPQIARRAIQWFARPTSASAQILRRAEENRLRSQG